MVNVLIYQPRETCLLDRFVIHQTVLRYHTRLNKFTKIIRGNDIFVRLFFFNNTNLIKGSIDIGEVTCFTCKRANRISFDSISFSMEFIIRFIRARYACNS